jgi:hypothetical protein
LKNQREKKVSQKKKARAKNSPASFGKLPAQYRFILNPYDEVRFSTCPECGRKTLLRKVPLAVHVDPHHLTMLNKHCRYCPGCDILICHQDELERLLAQAFREHAPEIISNDYLVLGTLDAATWRKRKKEPILMGDLPAYLHDFKAYLKLDYAPARWVPIKTQGSEKEPAPNLTIDDPKQVEALLEKMAQYLPIRAEIRRETARSLAASGISIPSHRQVSIQKILYHGDEGGIVCSVSPPGDKEVMVVSLTHLNIPYPHPLAREIRDYQKARVRKLAQEGRQND